VSATSCRTQAGGGEFSCGSPRSCCRERKRIGRRRVKPLHVIDRHQEREVFQEHTKDAENPECDRATCNRPGLASARSSAIWSASRCGSGSLASTSTGEGCQNCVHSCRGSVVLVDEAAEAIAAVDIAAGHWLDLCGFGLSECEPAVWALAVVVLDVDAQDVFEVAAAEDQQPVETLAADGADERFRVRVRLWGLAPACG
jgi:hypothetical protein